MKKLLLSLSLSILASTAYAADAVVEEVVVDVVPGFTWTGGYIGGHLGYAWGDAFINNDAFGNNPDPDGFIGGVYGGFNYQMANAIVIGAEVDAVYAAVDGVGQTYSLATGLPFDETIEQELKWSGAARARLGYAFDRFLPYIAGGVAFGKVEARTSAEEVSDTYVGWTIGGGVDYAFTDNLIGRVEYRYTDFGSENFIVDSGPISMDLATNEIRFGIAYKF